MIKILEINKWKWLIMKVMWSETTTNNNQCQQCSKSFASEEELTQHMNQEHVGNV